VIVRFHGGGGGGAAQVMGGFIAAKQPLVDAYLMGARQRLFSIALTIPDTGAARDDLTRAPGVHSQEPPARLAPPPPPGGAWPHAYSTLGHGRVHRQRACVGAELGWALGARGGARGNAVVQRRFWRP
jgi:hypothetical protein